MSNTVFNIPEGYEMGPVPGVYQRAETTRNQEIDSGAEQSMSILGDTVEVTTIDGESHS